MSQPRGFGLNGKSIYTNVAMPKVVFVTFTINKADTGGLGVTSVKSNGYVNYLFMGTSATPGVTAGVTNPNPQDGFGLVSFTNTFNSYLGMRASVEAPATSTSTTSVTAGHVYSITALGTATLAQWQAKGLPQGVTPTIGQAFVATASGSIGGSAHVGIPGVSLFNISEVGDPNQTISNSNISVNGGAQVIFQFTDLSITGTVSQPTLTMDSYTPAGTNSAATFTGSALGTHSHTLNLKNAAVADDATTRVNAGSNLLGANTGSDITIAGGGANGGIAAVSAGTPAGTNSAATFTGSAATLTGTVSQPTFSSTSGAAAAAPADGTVVRAWFFFDGSSVTIDGL